jgi:hypothetical protein
LIGNKDVESGREATRGIRKRLSNNAGKGNFKKVTVLLSFPWLFWAWISGKSTIGPFAIQSEKAHRI